MIAATDAGSGAPRAAKIELRPGLGSGEVARAIYLEPGIPA